MSQRPVELIPTLRLPKTFRMSPDCTALRVEQLKHAPQNYCSAFTEPVADRLVATIGGGRRRMLTLAGALLPDPDFIFLDEPTNAIDPMSQRACWELLSERAAQARPSF